MASDAYSNAQIEREIVLSRVVAAPRDVVFAAWSDSRRMFQWFAPAGMHCEVHAHGLGIMGGFGGRRVTSPSQAGTPVIIVTGLAIMGGVGIRRRPPKKGSDGGPSDYTGKRVTE